MIRFWALIVLWGTVSLLLSDCASFEMFPEHQLSEKILWSHPDYPGKLTQRVCEATDGKDCTKWKTLVYDLENSDFRMTVNKFDFVCSVGGKRYNVCWDKPGFCRIGAIKKCHLAIFCKETPVEIDYIPAVEQVQFLVDANTRCANKRLYDLDN